MPIMATPPIPERLNRKVWEKTTWEPHDLQREILLSPARNKVVALGRRAGKSQTGGKKLVPEAFRTWYEMDELKRRGLRREFWIVGPEYSDSEKEFRVVWNDLTRLGFPMDHPGSYNNSESGQMRISMFNERLIIHAKSAKYPSTLVGEGLSGVILAEAAKLKPSVWLKYIRPTLADFSGWSMFNSTPEGKNWFYDLWMAGQDAERIDWQSWRAPSWVNPHVYPGGVNTDLLESLIEARRKGKRLLEVTIQELRRGGLWGRIAPTGINEEIWEMFLDMSQELFNQEVAALFTEYVGRVFKNFDEELHVTDQQFDPTWATYACADYGFTNPFVWLLLQVDPHNERVHVLDEYYETNKSTPEAAAEIAARGLAPRTIRQFFPDPAEPDRTKELANTLRIRPYNRGSIELADRIEWIRRSLKPGMPDDAPIQGVKLTINRKCTNLIREMNDYKYKETVEQASEKGRQAPEKPLSKDDHAPEALGRFFSGHFGKPWSDTKSGTRQSRVNTRR
jgi:hypothetical protein